MWLYLQKYYSFSTYIHYIKHVYIEDKKILFKIRILYKTTKIKNNVVDEIFMFQFILNSLSIEIKTKNDCFFYFISFYFCDIFIQNFFIFFYVLFTFTKNPMIVSFKSFTKF